MVPHQRKGLGAKLATAAGIAVASVGMGVLVAAGFAAVGAGAPIAAVIGIPALLLLTGSAALVGGGMDGVSSPYASYPQDPRARLRGAAFQQQRRRQQQMGNFPTPGAL
jgi:hypothetical protein